MKNEVNFVWIHSERYQDGAHSPNISLRWGRLRTITEQKTQRAIQYQSIELTDYIISKLRSLNMITYL